ncbi:acyl-CoA dehydrogenase family protein [Bacteriovoracaceae bacterium]|nr:acyl-CoA dehydrogenase family protein [Bacteriovoracaceae bacterium]
MYQELDYMNLDSILTEEEKQIKQMVRKFVTNEYMPTVSENYEKGHFDRSIVPKLGELGLLGSTLPEKYGCANLSNISYGIINQELERGDSGLRSFASVQSSLVMYPIFAFGSEEQKDKWLPKLAKGEAIGCFGLTEPDHGSDPSSMITNAKDKGDHYLLNGAKMWITSGSIADIAIVWAKLDGGKVRGFLVETNLEGFTQPEIKAKYSLRASVTSELVFDNVKVPKDAILPKVEGLKGPLSCLTQARYGISWGAIGAAQACFDEALNYTKERSQFGKPLAQFQLTQKKLAEIATEITKAQLLSYQLGKLKDAGTFTPAQVSMAKMNNVQIALDAARTTRNMLGANGVSSEYQSMRHMCNLESVYTYEGTHEIHSLVVGMEVTGLNAFK